MNLRLALFLILFLFNNFSSSQDTGLLIAQSEQDDESLKLGDEDDQEIDDELEEDIKEESKSDEEDTTSVAKDEKEIEPKKENDKFESTFVEAKKTEDIKSIVEVEKQSEFASKTCDCKYNYLADYRLRRERWGFLFGLGGNSYNPDEYEPDFVSDTNLKAYYGKAEGQLIEVSFGIKINFSLGSISVKQGGGMYTNKGEDDSTLVLYPVHTDAEFALDALFSEPYVVPYFFGGTYAIYYKETQASKKLEGYTSFGGFYGAGFKLQLDWLDKDSDISSFIENGIENTFLYLEGRKFLAGLNKDFSSSAASAADLGVGLAFEW